MTKARQRHFDRFRAHTHLLRLQYALRWLPLFLPYGEGASAFSLAVQKLMQQVWNATPSLAGSKDRVAFGLGQPKPEEEIRDSYRRLDELDALLRPIFEQGRSLDKRELAAFDAMVDARRS